MKLVIRADDVGYSKVHNLGTFETLDRGVVTSVDIMLDTPGTEEALEKLREYPWISIGWHTHFWGCPVLGGSRVPTLFDPERDGFRKDLDSPEVDFDEALAECRAQVERCIKLLGRAPDVGGSFVPLSSPFGRACQQVHEEYGIVTDFMGRDIGKPGEIRTVQNQWADRKIYVRGIWDYIRPLRQAPLGSNGYTDSISALSDYDPIRFYVEDESGLLKIHDGSITVHPWHPGYVDYFVYRCGDHSAAAPVFKGIRTVDVHALCSPEVKRWIRENGVELINMRDALYGTREYQNHLRAMGSPLAI